MQSKYQKVTTGCECECMIESRISSQIHQYKTHGDEWKSALENILSKIHFLFQRENAFEAFKICEGDRLFGDAV